MECVAASDDNSSWILPTAVWMVNVTVALVGLFGSARRLPMLWALALAIVFNPLTDRGAFFVPWDTADTVPFTGLWITGAAVVTGVLLLVATRSPAAAPSRAVREVSAAPSLRPGPGHRDGRPASPGR